MPREHPSGTLPWITSRVLRHQAGLWRWWSFPVGVDVRCPTCAHALACFGEGISVAVRIHPRQERHRPTQRYGESRQCSGCNRFLDLAFRDVDAEADAA
jgi:hypothetical protein